MLAFDRDSKRLARLKASAKAAAASNVEAELADFLSLPLATHPRFRYGGDTSVADSVSVKDSAETVGGRRAVPMTAQAGGLGGDALLSVQAHQRRPGGPLVQRLRHSALAHGPPAALLRTAGEG